MKDESFTPLVIIPAFNEEESIGAVIADIRSLGIEIHILVINDGSTDATERVAKESGADTVLSFPFNLGIGAAVQLGFLFAERKGYPIVVRLDADGQHLSREIPGLLAEVRSTRADVAIGSRFVTNASSDPTTRARRAGIAFLSLLCRLLTGRCIHDPTSGFRAYSSIAVSLLAREYPIDYPEPDELVLLGRKGMRIAELPVSMRKRKAGFSTISGWRTMFYMAKVSLSVCMVRLRE